MFASKLNKALLFALIISIASPAHAWDVRGWFSSFSPNKKVGFMAGAAAVVVAGLGYLAWKCLKSRAAHGAWKEMIDDISLKQAKAAALKKQAEELEAQRKKDRDQQVSLAINRIFGIAGKQQAEKQKKEADQKAKKSSGMPSERMENLKAWWNGIKKTERYVATVESQLAKITKADGSLIIVDGQMIQLAPSDSLTDCIQCDAQDLTLIKQWCADYRAQNSSSSKKKEQEPKTFFDVAYPADWYPDYKPSRF